MNQFNALYSESFSDRHIGPRQSDLNAMLNTIGVKSLDELINHLVPSNIRLPKPLSVDSAISEVEFLSMLREKEIGSLMPGKLADFAVIDRDFFTIPEKEIFEIKNLMTGQDVEIPSDTPWCCNPASETYWSM